MRRRGGASGAAPHGPGDRHSRGVRHLAAAEQARVDQVHRRRRNGVHDPEQFGADLRGRHPEDACCGGVFRCGASARGPFGQSSEERARRDGPGRWWLDEFARRSIPQPVRAPFLFLLLPLLAAAAAAPPARAAGCGDAPAPGVDWRRCLLAGRDLAGADLTGAVLRDASLDRVVLKGAKLARVDAQGARFVSADLSGADLRDAVLRRADMTRADLIGATLVRTDLRRARFYGADLSGADLTGALLEGADLLRASLGGARWTDGSRICAEGSVGACQ